MTSHIGRSIFLSVFVASFSVLAAQSPPSNHGAIDSLRLFYVGRPVGWEHYELKPTSTGLELTADLDYIDRGRRNHVQSTTVLAADFTPSHLEVARVTDTARTVTTRVDVDGNHATVLRDGQTHNIVLSPGAFAISPYTPVSQHLALIRYWKSHGSPGSLAVVPGGPINRVTIRKAGVDTVGSGAHRAVLTRYTIDGVVWGIEYLWLDDAGRLALFTSAAGGLSFKAVRGELVPLADELMTVAARAAMSDLASISSRTTPIAEGKVALVGATLIDGSARGAVSNATVIVGGGRVLAAGDSAHTPVPVGARRIDVHGKTIIPGLWDMHAHLHQLEWIPVYIAAGVTSVRDMGNEAAFVTALRKTVESRRALGSTLYFAGLIDGPGPNAFGALSAATPEEGRAIVRQYHAAGYEQMKLYSLLAPNVVGAICDEAHKLGMTVTGHIPNSLSLLAAVDSGMDQVAHLPLRGDPQSDSVKRVIAHLRAKGTVIDPTASWGEIGGHSTSESVQNFQPVLQHLPPALIQSRVASWGSATVDSATAHARLARTLLAIRALHDAGVPIVAGTDEGVPGFSVYREIELYVMAGMTPLDAIRSATSVSAKAMRVDKDVGTIEPGKRADLLVLDANPLDNISNIRTLKLVMKDGRLYESAALWRAAGFTP
jgi:imidazolonepropionase-like amidohydrolase